jgi:hypothetical protein
MVGAKVRDCEEVCRVCASDVSGFLIRCRSVGLVSICVSSRAVGSFAERGAPKAAEMATVINMSFQSSCWKIR